ncbi:hypothetical protein [Oceanicola sp. S124]|nr:hypothetical protein [Oceanicola sp. S124]
MATMKEPASPLPPAPRPTWQAALLLCLMLSPPVWGLLSLAAALWP